MRRVITTRKNIFIGLVILAVLFSSFRVYSSAAGRLQYETAEVKKTAITQKVTASGEIKSEEEVELKPPVSGKLVYLAVKRNERIEKWKYLASLDKNIIQAQFEKARADWVAAVHNLKSKEKQFQDYFDVTTKEKEIQTAKAASDAAWSTLQAADFALRNTDLFSPIAGVVTKVHTHEGTNVTSATPIVTIADPDNMVFVAKVNEADIVQVAVGQEAVVTLDAFSSRKFTGHVTEVDFAATAATNGGSKSYQVKITIGDLTKVKLDMSGDVDIMIASQEGLAVPKLAVFETDGKQFVKVWDGKEVKQKEVTTGIKGSGGIIEIIAGLNAGEQVIISPAK